MRELARKIHEQNQARQEWQQHDSPHTIATQIAEEAQELVDAVDNYDALPNGVFEIASEIGDILYLALKFCNDMGLDPEEAVKLKLMRNAIKYPDHFSSNGWEYPLSQKLSKDLYQAMGGDAAFFKWYEQTMPLEGTVSVDGNSGTIYHND